MASPGTPSSKDVSVREQAEEEAIDERLLADDDLSHLAVKRRNPAGCVLHPLLELADLPRHDGPDGGRDAVRLFDALAA